MSFLQSRLRAACAAVLVLAGATQAPAATSLTPETWTDHVRDDLLGYWSQVITSGQAASGAFPGQLCDDGGLRNPPACRAGAARYLVSQSRQVYSYTVAFQMTGDPQYLAFAKAGVAEMEAQFIDPATGLYSRLPGGAAVLDAQQQAYGLLGPSYYAYVTGDAGVQARVEATAATISATFRDPATGAWGKTGTPTPGDALRLVDQLDQLNAYMTLMAATAPAAATRAAFLQDGLETAAFILDNFSFDDPASGLIKQATTARGAGRRRRPIADRAGSRDSGLGAGDARQWCLGRRTAP